MPEFSKDVVSVIYALLPGFIAAWIFFGLTAHPKQSPFERVVQALIFTGISRAVVIVCREVAFLFGRLFIIGVWSSDVELVFSIVVGVLLGLIFAIFSNHDWFHGFLRNSKWFKWCGGLTSRTSYPSEWFSAFHQYKRSVVLHLDDGRRIYGWPYEWPDTPDSGHFQLTEAEWLLDNNDRVPLYTVERILIPAKQVKIVEFEKHDDEVTASAEQIKNAVDRLLNLQPDERKESRGEGENDE